MIYSGQTRQFVTLTVQIMDHPDFKLFLIFRYGVSLLTASRFDVKHSINRNSRALQLILKDIFLISTNSIQSQVECYDRNREVRDRIPRRMIRHTSYILETCSTIFLL